MELDDWVPILRLGLAAVAGAVVGWERERFGRSAGLRTHMLVSLGCALFVVSLPDAENFHEQADSVARVIQGVAAGIGFLGAGEIMERGRRDGSVKVEGLTSAAAVWVSAGLGVSAGAGMWSVCLVACFLAFLILTTFKRLEPKSKREERAEK